VDEESRDDGERVHAQLAAHQRQVLHLHQLPSDQEQDAHRSVPGRGERDPDT